MLFIHFFLVLVIVFLVLAFTFQVAIPFMRGTPLFPFFRKSETSDAIEVAESELEKLNELEQLNELRERINSRKAQLGKESK